MTLATACRSNGVSITLFVAPQAVLMQVPLVGPLVYVPMQFAAAWLLNLLLTDVPTRPLVAVSQGSQVTFQHACPCMFGHHLCDSVLLIPVSVSRRVEAFSNANLLTAIHHESAITGPLEAMRDSPCISHSVNQCPVTPAAQTESATNLPLGCKTNAFTHA